MDSGAVVVYTVRMQRKSIMIQDVYDIVVCMVG